ncbi:Holliday junction resolvase RuvX [Rhodospirillales bacterium]|jgi:putative Holliday junction resolvase|nr:Holliday junction resolvase RuvX [Rhodospirillales bacterium]
MSRPDVFENIAALLAALTTGQRLLGLDIGDKTIGLAISDPMFMIASPVKTIMRTEKFATAVAEMREIVKNEEVGGLLVGLPVSMDGTEGPRCQKTRDLTSEISMQLNLPVAFWDERLSTSAIERFLVTEADMTRKRRKDVVDKMAAGYILQGALDSIAGRF